MPERIRRVMRSGPVAIAIVVSICAQLATAGLLLYATSEARQEVCRKVDHAFDGYTDALVVTFSRGEKPSQDILDAEATLRASFADEFNDCS